MSEGAEGDVFMGARKSIRKGSFGVESKSFEVEVEEQKGMEQATIVERKGGISLWIRLGPKSIGFFFNGLVLCIKDAGFGKWERKWRESRRAYSLVWDQKRGGRGVFSSIRDCGPGKQKVLHLYSKRKRS